MGRLKNVNKCVDNNHSRYRNVNILSKDKNLLGAIDLLHRRRCYFDCAPDIGGHNNTVRIARQEPGKVLGGQGEINCGQFLCMDIGNGRVDAMQVGRTVDGKV